jgi:hypothetical protein
MISICMIDHRIIEGCRCTTSFYFMFIAHVVCIDSTYHRAQYEPIVLCGTQPACSFAHSKMHIMRMFVISMSCHFRRFIHIRVYTSQQDFSKWLHLICQQTYHVLPRTMQPVWPSITCFIITKESKIVLTEHTHTFWVRPPPNTFTPAKIQTTILD